MRDFLRSTITLVTLAVTLLMGVAFFYACRSGGTDHLREEEYEDVGAAPEAEAPAYALAQNRVHSRAQRSPQP